MSLLPSTTYTAPPRLGRGRALKTISETEECTFALRSDSEGDDSDRTIIARPAGLDAKLASVAAARNKIPSSSRHIPSYPVDSSPCSTASSEDMFRRHDERGSYADSDAGTVFSEDSCPSLAGSNDTTFYTNSSRNSVISSQSARSSRNRYPSILIPSLRGSWQEESNIKEVSLPISPPHKIMLSPQALSALPQNVPSLNAPPSLGDGSSMASNSPGIAAITSAPITPDLHNIVPAEGQSWGNGITVELPISMPIEIAMTEEQSIVGSPRAPQSVRDSAGYSTDWSDMVVRFPTIPGATPQENTPIEPDFSDLRGFRMPENPDRGVQLPTDALDLLKNLTRSYSPVSESYQSSTTVGKVEMKERSDSGVLADIPAPTPTLSDYSFSQLSIPSPGGFFSSLQANSRNTWALPSQVKNSSLPSSAVAENFYDLPFKRQSQTVETIMEVPDRETTDGPPTARQPGFEIPSEYRAQVEDDDLYGAPVTAPKYSPGFEYEATYEHELKQAAEAHVDRTNDWLSAQGSYLSALRETNPLNDPAEYIPQTPNPMFDEEAHMDFDKSCTAKAVQFLEDATKIATTSTAEPKSESPKDTIFLDAFEHSVAQKGKQDAFLQASARLESMNAARVAMPLRHVQNLLNVVTSDTIQAHVRPKYRGPYHQNPRATGQFSKTKQQILFAEAERKQLAMQHILPITWQVEAQRKILYQGKTLGCSEAINILKRKDKKHTRVLDLAGATVGSWAWSVADKYPHVQVTTVQTESQSQTISSLSGQNKSASSSMQPQSPSNHKVVSVRQLWKLPFRDNYFDIISARTLYMLLKSRPVPDVPSIDEWNMTLKECFRVLKPNGVFDFIVMDSHISNNSSDNRSKHCRGDSNEASISPTAAVGQGFTSPPPTATFGGSTGLMNPAGFNFGRDLKKNGYDADGGASKITDRLQKQGFTAIQRQWVGLPVGRTEKSHDNVAASYEHYEAAPKPVARASTAGVGLQRSKIGSISQANGRSRTPFPPAPRPISEVSSISRIIEQYANVEAVHGPVGSTADVSDMAGLAGAAMWEEWLVRHRLEVLNTRKGDADDTEQTNAVFQAENLLAGINDILAAGYAKGACFRAVIGWARKPSNKPVVPKKIVIDTNTDNYAARAAELARANPTFEGFPSDETPVTADAKKQPSRKYVLETPVSQFRRDLSLDTNGMSVNSQGSPFSYTQSAVERGEVGEIHMMIVE